jgi:glutamate formiminotransferase/formiminotetrahydrofolate cyclodeaminase
VAGAVPLVSLSVGEFADAVSADSPAPGGGSVAALCGAMAAALTAMVANLTFGKKGYEAHDAEMNRVAVEAQALKAALLRAVDEDTQAFDAVMAAGRLPKATEEEQAARDAAVQAATLRAIEVPLSVMRECARVLPLLEIVAANGNRNSISDAGVAALALKTAAGGAYFNVLINVPGIADRKRAERLRDEARALLDELAGAMPRVSESIEQVIGA